MILEKALKRVFEAAKQHGFTVSVNIKEMPKKITLVNQVADEATDSTEALNVFLTLWHPGIKITSRLVTSWSKQCKLGRNNMYVWLHNKVKSGELAVVRKGMYAKTDTSIQEISDPTAYAQLTAQLDEVPELDYIYLDEAGHLSSYAKSISWDTPKSTTPKTALYQWLSYNLAIGVLTEIKYGSYIKNKSTKVLDSVNLGVISS